MPQQPGQKPCIAVSYAWQVEDTGEHSGMVEQLAKQAKDKKCDVRQDRTEMKTGESVRKFMDSLPDATILCVFLNDTYLRSPYCMYELLHAWKKAGEDAETFVTR